MKNKKPKSKNDVTIKITGVEAKGGVGEVTVQAAAHVQVQGLPLTAHPDLGGS